MLKSLGDVGRGPNLHCCGRAYGFPEPGRRVTVAADKGSQVLRHRSLGRHVEEH